jgi:hypothetical protein
MATSGKMEVKDDEIERTKKREPGKIQRAIKVALVGDGTVKSHNRTEKKANEKKKNHVFGLSLLRRKQEQPVFRKILIKNYSSNL